MLRLLYADFEMASLNPEIAKQFPSTKLVKHDIISIVAYDNYKDTYYLFLYRNDLIQKQWSIEKELLEGNKKVIIYYSDIQKNILIAFAKLVGTKDADFLLTWYGDNFDIPYFFTKCKQLGILNQVYNIMFPHQNIRIDHRYMSMPGLKSFDLLKASKKILGKYSNNSLQAVSMSKLKVGKMGETMSAIAAWKYDLDKLIDYNIRDVELMVMLDKKIPIFSFFKKQIELTGASYIDSLMANYKICQQFIKHNKSLHPFLDHFMIEDLDEENHKGFKGAITMEAIAGIYNFIAVHDLKMMYPMIIISCNMSPETVIRKDKSKYSTEEWKKMNPVCVNGVYFRTDFEGFIVILIKKQILLRIEIEKRISEFAKKYGKGFEKTETFETLMQARLSVKGLINSWYGIFGYKGFFLYDIAIAESVTYVGRKQIMWSRNFVKKKYGIDTKYGDSVRANTPITVKLENGLIQIIEIQYLNSIKGKLKVWTEKGWTEIKQIIKHRVKKEIFRVLTHTGFIEVTEDHSLLDPTGKEISPKDIEVGLDLLHSSPTPENSIICDCLHNPLKEYYNKYNNGLNLKLLNSCIHEKVKFIDSIRQSTINVFYGGDNLEAQGIYKILTDIGYTVTVSQAIIKGFILRAVTGIDQMRNKIKKIKSLGICDEVVYDLETENHHFAAGVGQMIVHNTDSIFTDTPSHVANFKFIRSVIVLINKIEQMEVEDWELKLDKVKRIDYLKKLIEPELKKVADFHVKISIDITKSYDDFAKLFNIKNHTFQMAFEKLYSRIFFSKAKNQSVNSKVGAKKRYVGHIIYKDGKLVWDLSIAGFPVKRSDTAKITSKCQKETFNSIIFRDDHKVDVQKIVMKYYNIVKNAQLDPVDIGIPKGFGEELKNYKKNNRNYRWYAAQWSNDYLGTNFGKGDKPRGIALKYLPPPYNSYYMNVKHKFNWMAFDDDNPLREEFIPCIDWNEMSDKSITEPMKAIVESIGLRISSIKTGKIKNNIKEGF